MVCVTVVAPVLSQHVGQPPWWRYCNQLDISRNHGVPNLLILALEWQYLNFMGVESWLIGNSTLLLPQDMSQCHPATHIPLKLCPTLTL